MNSNRRSMANEDPPIEQRIKSAIDDAFVSARGSERKRNFLKSSTFVECVAQKLNELCIDTEQRCMRVITTDEETRQSGEWLLDAVIMETIDDNFFANYGVNLPKKVRPFPKKILWALESESSTSLNDFIDDFSKLISVRSSNYLYLNGIDQGTLKGVNDYIEARLRIVQALLREAAVSFPIYVGFWASPKKPPSSQGIDSIWDALDADYIHLKGVRLFSVRHDQYSEILSA